MVALVASACADRGEPVTARLTSSLGPADGPLQVLEVYDQPAVLGCDTVNDGKVELSLAFDGTRRSGEVYEFSHDEPSDGWGHVLDDEGEERDVVHATMVIESLDDDRAHLHFTAVVAELPEIADELVDVDICKPRLPW
ncbi:MAG TPA: hypothetical protein VG755_10405 [Nannocystaceae bacterium]|nr:hypothetical protein [Nannocystaceae bacterium]